MLRRKPKQPKRVPPDIMTMAPLDYLAARERYIQEEMNDVGWFGWLVIGFFWLLLAAIVLVPLGLVWWAVVM